MPAMTVPDRATTTLRQPLTIIGNLPQTASAIVDLEGNVVRGAYELGTEDVLIGVQMNDPGAFEAFKSLDDIVPRPDHKASGEERAWGRRLAKRFGIGNSVYEDRAFTARGDGSQAPVLDHESSKPEKTDPAVAEQFAGLDIDNGDTLIAFGWAMAEDLEKLL